MSPPAIRDLERASLRDFVGSCGPIFYGRNVLDYGCGRMPYRDIVDRAGGGYFEYDRPSFPGNVGGEVHGPEDPLAAAWDVILCTQVVQYLPHVSDVLVAFRESLLSLGGYLVLTGPTCWPEVEPEDLHRFTRRGIEALLRAAGFTVERLERRSYVEYAGEEFSLGWGAVAKA